ncbi:hypothetical protein Q8791_22960 [Nocardiopsis sp. CT-R113]|uniref:Uncharacterized protein n=1 Tax=Nocardiopsis codii TaxID=3065942 RepID=A0ABU7KCX6_9ACTN|nr:hypothetical protein [Nocardiopsis sp. CT-R113]MEE2040081.1 hypothetical protein [Nocardiopsis sp. CT-R113]
MTPDERTARQGEERDLIRRTIAHLRATADGAPRGPYTLDPHTQKDGTRLLLADDGAPIAHVRYWAGGLHDDTGSEEQTGQHLALWTRRAAYTTARLLDYTDQAMGDAAPYPPHTPDGTVWNETVALCRTLLNEHRRKADQ